MNRREFIQIVGGATALLVFPEVVLAGTKITLGKASKRTSVIWLQGQSCSGDSVSLLNAGDPDIAAFITNRISLHFHQTLSTATGDTAIDILLKTLDEGKKNYVLVVEGSIPTKSETFCTIGEVNGKPRGVREWVELLAKNAKAVVAVGTCAAYGCIPAARMRSGGENPTGAMPVWGVLPGAKQINIPGCPAHPDWIIGSLVHLIMGKRLRLDAYGRPLLYYKTTVHDKCEHLQEYRKNEFARSWGDKGCLFKLGCLGIDSNCDIPVRKWLGVNSCTGCGAGCIGCTEPVFPDTGERGLFTAKKA
ncbi:MAG TPA: hydrogenase small subunit [Chitinivibrionales bacterium]|nr:hydrogenase small subunit [Chitinivibrionales bacterium]